VRAPVEEALENWFRREILAHEASLVRYLLRASPNAQDVHDLRQDTYMRVFEAAFKSRPYAPKAFLFATARNLLVDHVRRQRTVFIDTVKDLDTLEVLIDEISPEQRALADQELQLVAEAIDRLPVRCRQTVWMRRVDALSQREVAIRLGVTEKAVEKQLSKGMLRLAAALVS
jgi:RNA polymerase sigma factor (sigma-70 family)